MDITVEELKAKLDSKEKFVFIDVREQYEYDEFNLGARLLPLGDLPYKLTEISDDTEAEIIVYCRSGARSGMAKSLLTNAGFSNVRNLMGGVLDWQEKFGKG
ncbi:MAG: rhodanese-like domain-containing protein [Saprospiraceae bacterium]